MSKSKRKQAARRGRAIVPEPWYRRVPLMPVVVAALIGASAITAGVWAATHPASGAGASIDGIPCETGEQVATHYHAHLEIYVNGTPALVPAGVGIDSGTQCLYWLHSHATDGVIHIEAPKNQARRNFTLGEFFDIWKKRLDSTHIGDTTVTKGEKLYITVDGRSYTGDPAKIVLKPHEQIVIQVVSSGSEPITPTPFQFPAGE